MGNAKELEVKLAKWSVIDRSGFLNLFIHSIDKTYVITYEIVIAN